MVNEEPSRIRRREIVDADLGGVTDLLVRGFPARPPAYWQRGLRRMGERPAVAGYPRYGFLLESGARPVGVALMLFDARGEGEARLRCNLSSWTVDPAFRMQASLLIASVLKRRDVTFVNLSAAPHTWATIEAQGFRAYADGQFVVAPALARDTEAGRAVADRQAWRGLPEARLLDDHRGYGCLNLVVEAADGAHPFVFLPVRARSGRVPLPLHQLIFSRDLSDLWRFAGTLGRALLARGSIGVLVDGAPPPGGPPILRRHARGRSYFKGPHAPRLGDLSYTERVMFGP